MFKTKVILTMPELQGAQRWEYLVGRNKAKDTDNYLLLKYNGKTYQPVKDISKEEAEQVIQYNTFLFKHLKFYE